MNLLNRIKRLLFTYGLYKGNIISNGGVSHSYDAALHMLETGDDSKINYVLSYGTIEQVFEAVDALYCTGIHLEAILVGVGYKASTLCIITSKPSGRLYIDLKRVSTINNNIDLHYCRLLFNMINTIYHGPVPLKYKDYLSKEIRLPTEWTQSLLDYVLVFTMPDRYIAANADVTVTILVEYTSAVGANKTVPKTIDIYKLVDLEYLGVPYNALTCTIHSTFTLKDVTIETIKTTHIL